MLHRNAAAEAIYGPWWPFLACGSVGDYSPLTEMVLRQPFYLAVVRSGGVSVLLQLTETGLQRLFFATEAIFALRWSEQRFAADRNGAAAAVFSAEAVFGLRCPFFAAEAIFGLRWCSAAVFAVLRSSPKQGCCGCFPPQKPFLDCGGAELRCSPLTVTGLFFTAEAVFGLLCCGTAVFMVLRRSQNAAAIFRRGSHFWHAVVRSGGVPQALPLTESGCGGCF